MNLKFLNNRQLIDYTREKAASERKIYKEILEALHEVAIRQAYFDENCNTLHEFVVTVLKYSDGAADRRIKAMELLYGLPEKEIVRAQEKIKDGSLNLTHLSNFQRAVLQAETPVTAEVRVGILKRLESTRGRECEKILLSEFPGYEPRREQLKTMNEKGDARLSITLTAEAVESLEKFIALTAHRNPYAKKDKAIELALKVACEVLDPAKRKNKREIRKELQEGENSVAELRGPEFERKVATTPKSNSVAEPVRKTVRAQDRQEAFRKSGACQWIDPRTGKRCGSVFKLELDHIQPVSRNGGNEPENLQVLCRNHNQYKSDRLEMGG